MPVEGFRNCHHRWLSVATLDAELEVQRAIKRAELTTFLCLFRKAIGLAMVHVDDRGISDGLWRGERRCIGPKSEGR